MKDYEKWKGLPIDHSAIGLEQSDTQVTYYCTPKDAQIIGWAGVDGIHYCTIPEFGEMIFAVSPMNFGDCVRPIARNFPDLLRLLLFCGDMAALEQCYAWDVEQFKAFLIDCPITQKQKAVLDAIQREFGLEPMADAFSYVKTLQREFDLSRIPYTKDYYDPDMNPAAPSPAEWKVTYDGGFWPKEGRPGKALPLEKAFSWGEEQWRIPAAYACGKGLVVDFCVSVSSEKVQAWMEKWDLLNEDQHRYTDPQQRQIQRENPLEVDFRPVIRLNGKPLREDRGTGMCWIPASCTGGVSRNRRETEAFLEHYGLDKTICWAIRRKSFPWATARKPSVKSLELRLLRELADIPGLCFPTPEIGASVRIPHPLKNTEYTLTVCGWEPQEMDASRLADPVMEYPTHYYLMSYTLEPELPGRSYFLRDLAQGDEPRIRKTQLSNRVEIGGEAAAIGIIGGADGPTAVFIGAQRTEPTCRAACSSLHFDPAESVEWEFCFREKLLPDLDVRLL